LAYASKASGLTALGIAVDANGIIAVASGQFELGDPETAVVPVTSTEAEVPQAATTVDPGEPVINIVPVNRNFLKSNNAVYIGAIAVFLAVALVMFIVLSAQRTGPSALDRLDIRNTVNRTGLAGITDRATLMADRLLEKQKQRGALDAALETAGIDMRPGEYLLAMAGGSLGLAAFGFVMLGPVAAIAALLVGLVFGRLFVNFKAGKRRKLFGTQLGDTLMMMAGSLRAGHGVVEAIDTVASRASSPTSDEFTRAVAESRIGRDMVESLYDIASRTDSEDFIWVVRAISINRELGGDLAEILDNVGETIRDRNRLRDQVKALSAEGKVSALILFALPIVVGGWVRVSNPAYLESMTDQTAGKLMLGMAFLSLIVGGVWLKKLVNVQF
ncbi:MAG: type II secretion system F family protein, partial [Acidimicrobiales bacterium]